MLRLFEDARSPGRCYLTDFYSYLDSSSSRSTIRYHGVGLKAHVFTMDNPSILLEIASHLSLTQGMDTDTQLLQALRGVSTKAYSTLSPIYWDHVNPKLKIGPNYKLPTEFSMELIHTYRHLVLPKLSLLNTNYASLKELNLIRERIFPQLRQVTIHFGNDDDSEDHELDEDSEDHELGEDSEDHELGEDSEDQEENKDEQGPTKRQNILETSGEPELFSFLRRMDKLKVLTLEGYKYKDLENFGFQQAFEALVSLNAKIEVVWGFLGSDDEPNWNRLMDQLTPWKSRVILNLKKCYISSEIVYNMMKKLSEFCELRMDKLSVNMHSETNWGEYGRGRFRTFDFDAFDKLLLKLMELPKKLTISRYSYANFERNFLPNVPQGKVYANITTLSLYEFGTTLDFLHLFPKLEKLKLESCQVCELLEYDENNEEEGLNNIRRMFAREPKLKHIYIGGESSDLCGMNAGYELLEELVEKFEFENFDVYMDYTGKHKDFTYDDYDY